MKKYVDYMWLLRVSGSIILLSSILPLFSVSLYFVPFLCISAGIALWYCDKRGAIVVISVIAAIVMIVLFAREGSTWLASLWAALAVMGFLEGFLSGAFAIFTIFEIICIPAVFILCCCNKRIAATITSIVTVFAILLHILVTIFSSGSLLWGSPTGFLYGSFIEICIWAVFILCCCNKRTVATVICIAAVLASIPAMAYMELKDMSIAIFDNNINLLVFLGGALVIAWSWIMDSDFPLPVDVERAR